MQGEESNGDLSHTHSEEAHAQLIQKRESGNGANRGQASNDPFCRTEMDPATKQQIVRKHVELPRAHRMRELCPRELRIGEAQCLVEPDALRAQMQTAEEGSDRNDADQERDVGRARTFGFVDSIAHGLSQNLELALRGDVNRSGRSAKPSLRHAPFYRPDRYLRHESCVPPATIRQISRNIPSDKKKCIQPGPSYANVTIAHTMSMTADSGYASTYSHRCQLGVFMLVFS